MLSASAILRVVATLVVAAVLAAIWQALPPWSRTASAPQAPVVRPQPATPAPAPAPARPPLAEPAPPPTTPMAQAPAAPVPQAPMPPTSPPSPPRAVATTPPSPPPAQSPSARPVVVSQQPVLPSPPPVAGTAGAVAAREGTPAVADTRPVAVELLDLNTASVQQLNALRGGGLIGRAVVRGRPYGSVDELLSKRILSRSAYERIRDQVTAR